MTKFSETAIRDLPKSFVAEIHVQIRLFSLTMVVDNGVQPAYSFAGTACRIGGHRGILTARHVWEQIAKQRNLMIVAGRKQIALDPILLHAFVPDPERRLPDLDGVIPDIAFVCLPDRECANLEAFANKTFYSIDRRVSKEHSRSFDTTGYWAVFGAPQARLDPERGSVPSPKTSAGG